MYIIVSGNRDDLLRCSLCLFWESWTNIVASWGSAWFERMERWANECLRDIVPLIVINTLVIAYELVLG